MCFLGIIYLRIVLVRFFIAVNESVMNVIISGLTAAGKTTHRKILAEKFQLKYVSATETLVKSCGISGNDLHPN